MDDARRETLASAFACRAPESRQGAGEGPAHVADDAARRQQPVMLTPNEYLDMRQPEWADAERLGVVRYEPAHRLVRIAGQVLG